MKICSDTVFVGYVFLNIFIGCTFQNDECLPDEFECPDGDCIDMSTVCDEKNDCSDGADEMECNQSSDEYHISSRTIGSRSSRHPGKSFSKPYWQHQRRSPNIIITCPSYREMTPFIQWATEKLSKLKPQMYLLAEKLISRVLQEAQMNNLTYLSHLEMSGSYTEMERWN